MPAKLLRADGGARGRGSVSIFLHLFGPRRQRRCQVRTSHGYSSFPSFPASRRLIRTIEVVSESVPAITSVDCASKRSRTTARQLPDQSTTLRVDSSSTDDSRPRDALPSTD